MDLPKQEIFPETDAKNWEKVTSITGLSVTVTGNILGFKANPALLSASGIITYKVHDIKASPPLDTRPKTHCLQWI